MSVNVSSKWAAGARVSANDMAKRWLPALLSVLVCWCAAWPVSAQPVAAQPNGVAGGPELPSRVQFAVVIGNNKSLGSRRPDFALRG